MTFYTRISLCEEDAILQRGESRKIVMAQNDDRNGDSRPKPVIGLHPWDVFSEWNELLVSDPMAATGGMSLVR